MGQKMGYRSVQGCWTCRLRRKKCDEILPVCGVCVSLKIACDGYGPRPDWLDGGKLEKQRAATVKQLVAKTTLEKRRSRMRKPKMEALEEASHKIQWECGEDQRTGVLFNESPAMMSTIFEPSALLELHGNNNKVDLRSQPTSATGRPEISSWCDQDATQGYHNDNIWRYMAPEYSDISTWDDIDLSVSISELPYNFSAFDPTQLIDLSSSPSSLQGQLLPDDASYMALTDSHDHSTEDFWGHTFQNSSIPPSSANEFIPLANDDQTRQSDTSDGTVNSTIWASY